MSNAIQLRDASDVTRVKRERGTIQSYLQLSNMNQLPIGGIPHTDLQYFARRRATYIPMDSLTTVISANASGVITSTKYITTEIAIQSCSDCSGTSFQPILYQQIQSLK